MANVKISDLTADTAPISTALLEIETAGGNSRKVTAANLSKALGTYTGDSGAITLQKIDLPGLTDEAIDLEWFETISEGADAGQDDANNRAQAQGFRGQTTGTNQPLSAWRAHEPAYQVAANSHFWGELHDPEVTTRDGVHRRLRSMTWDYGTASHTGALIDSVQTKRIHKEWWNSPVTDAVMVNLDAVTGSQSWGGGLIQHTISGTYAAINIGMAPNIWNVAFVDTTDPNTRIMGPFVWYASGEGVIGFSASHLGGRMYYTTDGANITGFVSGTHSTHQAAATDLHGTIKGGIRRDGSYSFPTLTDAAAVNNSLYYSSTASKLVYKDASGTVNALY